jgi:hypothetical protein
MTTTYAAVQFIADGKPYIFSVDATDGSEATMVNVVSSRGLGDTFGAGARITHIGPVTLNSSDAAGASTSILGAVILDPQNNVVYQAQWADPEVSRLLPMNPINVQVGLNYAMKILTANA